MYHRATVIYYFRLKDAHWQNQQADRSHYDESSCEREGLALQRADGTQGYQRHCKQQN
jgi:hypothetical protein